jgi:hypothetical protein
MSFALRETEPELHLFLHAGVLGSISRLFAERRRAQELLQLVVLLNLWIRVSVHGRKGRLLTVVDWSQSAKEEGEVVRGQESLSFTYSCRLSINHVLARRKAITQDSQTCSNFFLTDTNNKVRLYVANQKSYPT